MPEVIQPGGAWSCFWPYFFALESTSNDSTTPDFRALTARITLIVWNV
jgi:hypothetical protein